ncbi:MAG: dihydroneopterin aldolase [Deltaproteobacteria bacterium]|nr:dihydroneopterin aldolase [Deltaproteobacteria bacterium]
MKTAGDYFIEINGLKLYGYHGVFEEENRLGQEFEINLLIKIDPDNKGDFDHPETVVSYAEVITQVKEIFSRSCYKLLEKLAQSILRGLESFPQIQYAKITLRKPSPPIPEHLDSVGVIMDFHYQ